MPMKNPPHPGGFVLRERIDPLRLTITQAASALGVTRTTLSELVNGKRGISPEMAVRLSKVFGGSAESRLAQQALYDLAQVRADRIKLKRLEVEARLKRRASTSGEWAYLYRMIMFKPPGVEYLVKSMYSFGTWSPA